MSRNFAKILKKKEEKKKPFQNEQKNFNCHVSCIPSKRENYAGLILTGCEIRRQTLSVLTHNFQKIKKQYLHLFPSLEKSFFETPFSKIQKNIFVFL